MPKNNKSDPMVDEVFCPIWQATCAEIIARAQTIQAADEDIECVHQYRVAVRKARSILLFMKPLLKEAFFTQTNLQLKQCADHFAKVREWDVLLEYYLNDYLNQVSEVAEQSRYLIAEHRHIREAAYANYDVNHVENVINSIQSDKDGLKQKAKRTEFSRFVKQRIKTLRKTIDQKEKQLKPDDYKRIHAYRIANKKLRYALESINPIFDMAYDKQIKRLKKKTDKLGRSCDEYFMHETLSSLESQRSEAMPSLGELIAFIEHEMTKNESKP